MKHMVGRYVKGCFANANRWVFPCLNDEKEFMNTGEVIKFADLQIGDYFSDNQKEGIFPQLAAQT
jgi:hypothetical protein